MSEANSLARVTPFFVADGKGVCVARPLIKSSAEIEAAFELATPAEDAAWGEAADVLTKSLAGRAACSPLIVDEPELVIAQSSADVFVLSAPPGAELAPEKLASMVAPIAKGWVAAVVDDVPHVAALAKIGAHLWRVDGLRGVLFASKEPALEDARVVAVSPPRARVTKDRRVRLMKADDPGELRFVLGIVLEPETVDSQGDIYSADEVRRACHAYMEDFQNVGHMHRTLINNGVKIVECYLAPLDFEIDGQPVKKGTWLLGVHVLSDQVWEQVKTGALTGFSIGGYAQRVPAQHVPTT